MQTICKNCGKPSPLKEDICDACGGVEFMPVRDDGGTITVKDAVEAQAMIDEAKAEDHTTMVAAESKPERAEEGDSDDEVDEKVDEIRKDLGKKNKKKKK